MAQILEISKDSPLKTQIMYKANLSFTQLNTYLKLMLINELIKQDSDEGKEFYVITKKGLNFLQRHYELTKMIEIIK